jgi:subtilisin-like proprotein convertase family protein
MCLVNLSSLLFNQGQLFINLVKKCFFSNQNHNFLSYSFLTAFTITNQILIIMRKFLLLVITTLCAFIGMAQVSDVEKNAALQLVSSQRAALGLSADDLNNLIVSGTYIDKSAGGVRLVYLQQTYKGIPVYNQIQVVAFKNGVLKSNTPGRMQNIAKFAGSINPVPALTAESAVRSAITDRGLVATQPALLIKQDQDQQKFEYSNMGASRENITAQLMWVPSDDGKQVSLGWQVYIIPKTTSDYWLVRVDASNSRTLGVTNLTEFDNWGTPEKNDNIDNTVRINLVENTFNTQRLFDFKPTTATVDNSPTIVNGATYLVVKYPLEAPNFGPEALHTDPWTLSPAGSNATTEKWHYDGTTNYNISRGNNVWAKEDRAGNNSNAGLPATSSTSPDPLTFNFPPNYTLAPTTPQNQQFAITNLFYWNNLMHDMSYLYGFDEASANFQTDNMGRGGLGNDWVYADAQDGGGTNNANFATPADGSNGRMQMYLFTAPNPQRDGDLDNGVVTHEYGHGISHRLTGGPGSGAGCMGNAERGDEGWSDYFALMMTQDWSTANVNTGFNSPRGIGTYVLNQAPTAAGIRCEKYCTNFAVNNLTYAMVAAGFPCGSSGEVHNIGEIWCATIWDMTWNIIQQVNSITPNMFTPGGTGGNIIAMKLVIMGEKLQKCSPGFLDSRDGILAADQLLYNGAYHCAIVTAFARRGMGFDAIQGSSGSTGDQVAGFSAEESSIQLTQSIPQQLELGSVTYTNTVKAYCAALNNYLVTDTLPTNVTYVSNTGGGTYNAGNRVISWPVNLAIGATGIYTVTVTINAGSYFAPVTMLNEVVAGASLPAGWTATSATGPSAWVSSSAQSHSAPNSLFGVDNATAITDFRIASPSVNLTAPQYPFLSFWHNFDTEPTWDGGVVEISTNGGGTWTDLGPYMTVNGYPSSLNAAGTNPIAGRNAFTGTSGGWIQTKVSLANYPGANALFRFRMTSDDNTAATGWYVDDINISTFARVDMRSSLFNGSGTRVHLSDTFTIILPPSGCVPQLITTQPNNVTTCNNTVASFSVTATGTPSPTYQWQVSTTGVGGPYNSLTNVAPYSGVTTPTLTITNALVAMNGYYYRCVVSGCASPLNSNAALLTVAAASVGGTINPANTPVCGTTNSGLLTLSGYTGSIVRWESATNIAGPYTPIVNTLPTYTFTNVAVTTYFRAVVQVTGCVAVTSSVATVTFTAAQPLLIVADPGTTLCQGDPALLTVVNGPTLFTFTNASPIIINSFGTATPYPGPLVVAGVPAGATVTNVQLFQFNHTWSGDVDVALTGPTFVAGGNTQAAMLLSDLGNDGFIAATNVNLTFQDGSPRVPATSPMVSGTYSCTNDGAVVDAMPFPGPTTTAATPLLTQLNAATMNGTWNLWINDQVGGDGGNVNGGYSITFGVPGGPIVGGTFTWSPALGLNQTTGNPVAASPAVTTTYTVNHNNGAGCIRQANITLTINLRPAVTTPPANTTVCAGAPATFTVAGVGAGLTYQWQESTTGIAGPYVSLANTAPYSGVNTATLTISPTTVAMNGYYYRCVLGGTCPPNVNSAVAKLSVNPLPVVVINPVGPVCGGVAGISGTALTASGANTYVWAPLAGLYLNNTASLPYLGTNAATVYAAPTALTSYTVTGTITATGCTNTATIAVNYTPPAPTITPSSVTMCNGDPAVKLKSSSSQSFTSTFTSGTVNITIPDGPNIPPVPVSYPATTSAINVSGIPANATMVNFRAKFNITHNYVGDLVMVLKAPNGAVFNLDAMLNKTNNPGSNFTNTIISSSGVTLLSAGAAPFTNTYKPDAVGATFTAFGFTFPGGPAAYIPTGTTPNILYSIPNGTWTVAMYDAGAPDAGVLNNWSLDIDYIVGVPATPAVWTIAPTPGANAGLFSDAAATTAYVAGTAVDSVWVKPLPFGVYNVGATVQSLPPLNAAPASPLTGGNGNNMITFNVANNNPYPMTVTGISSNTFGSGAITARAFYKVTPIAGNPGLISAANGWILFGTANSNAVANTLNAVLTGLSSLVIPANSTYGIALEITGATFAAYTNGSATTSVYSNNGCDLIVGGNVGWGGPAAPGPTVNNPREFNGTVFLSPGNFPACTSPVKTVVVTVNTQPVVTAQPASTAVCTDKVATFTVAATIGLGSFSYQWQVSTDNGNTYNDISNGGVYSGATTGTLTITRPPVTMNGYYYRCKMQGPAPCAPVYSFFRILTVYPLPTIVIAAAPYVKLFPGLSTTLTSTVSPFAAATYTWLRNGIAVSGGNTGTLNVDVDGLGDYTLRVTDVNGCTNTSNLISITDSVSSNCFLYPNPSSGKFQVRYYSVAGNTLPRTCTVYDAKGSRVFTGTFTITAPYARMDIDLTPFGKGVFWVELGDRNGNRIVVCRAVVD